MKPIEDRLKNTKPIENRSERALLNIMHTGSCLRNVANEALKGYDLTDSQYNVLRILRGQQGKPMNLFEIVSRMVHRDSNVSRIVDKLELKGLVERKVDEKNRRRVDITITPAGIELLQSIQPALISSIEATFSALKAEEIELLDTLLNKLRD